MAELEAVQASYGAGLRPVVSLVGRDGSGTPALVVAMQRLELELASDRAASVRMIESLLASAEATPVCLILDFQDCRASAKKPNRSGRAGVLKKIC